MKVEAAAAAKESSRAITTSTTVTERRSKAITKSTAATYQHSTGELGAALLVTGVRILAAEVTNLSRSVGSPEQAQRSASLGMRHSEKWTPLESSSLRVRKGCWRCCGDLEVVMAVRKEQHPEADLANACGQKGTTGPGILSGRGAGYEGGGPKSWR